MIYPIIKKIIILSSIFFYLTTYSSSEVSSKAWSTECSENKKICVSIIVSEIKDKDKKQILSTAYIKIASSKQKKMNLIDEEDQTYKLSEENKNVPILFVQLPFNVDLRKKPAIVIDKKKLGDLNFTHCNQNDGCVTNVAMTGNVIDLFKKGKTMSVITGIYGSNKNMQIEFPLRNFTKSYAKLIKE